MTERKETEGTFREGVEITQVKRAKSSRRTDG